jgi:hypothetical protein
LEVLKPAATACRGYAHLVQNRSRALRVDRGRAEPEIANLK